VRVLAWSGPGPGLCGAVRRRAQQQYLRVH